MPELLFVGIALLSFVSAEAWRRWALRAGVLDVPGQRSSHAAPTPRGAGVGLVFALLAGFALLSPPSPVRDAALLAITAAAVVGLVDDLRPLSPMLKLAGQALAALPLAWALPFAPLDAPAALAPVVAGVAAFGLGITLMNAWNFMDGINGIAALAAAAVAAVALLTASPAAALALALLAAALGFLPLNFPRARVFMGDCGSHGLGMAVAVLLLWPAPLTATLAAAAAASPFLVDVLGTVVRRARDGERITQAHRRHLYQLAVRSGYSHARVSLGYLFWMFASGASVAALATNGWLTASGAAAFVLLFNVTVWWVATDRLERRLSKEGRWK